MAQTKDPREKLAEALTQKKDEHDTFTDFPTSEAVHDQLHLRILGEPGGLDLPFFQFVANEKENLMLSYQRQSRGEAERGMGVKWDEQRAVWTGPRGEVLIQEPVKDEKDKSKFMRR